MSHVIETELKVLLSKEHFKKLTEHFHLSTQPTIVQRNTYYDTADSKLKLADSALRLRNFPLASEWTIKHRQDAFRSLEITQTNPKPINPSPATINASNINSPGLLEFLDHHAIDLASLHKTYDILTERWNIATEVGEYALDKSYFLGVTDYEIEFETDQLELAQIAFKSLLQQLNIPYRPANTKISRAVQYALEKCDKSV